VGVVFISLVCFGWFFLCFFGFFFFYVFCGGGVGGVTDAACSITIQQFRRFESDCVEFS